jgi:hypothetical protein
VKKIYIVVGYYESHDIIGNYAAFQKEEDAYKFTKEANQDICDYESLIDYKEEKAGGKLELSEYNDYVRNHPFQLMHNGQHHLIDYFDYQEIELS